MHWYVWPVELNKYIYIVYLIHVDAGMKESKEFALELFDALSRRRMLNTDKITIDEFLDFWSQITDDSFDSRLQIFFDMYVRMMTYTYRFR